MVDNWQTRRFGDFAERIRDINDAGLELEPLSVTKGEGVVLQSSRFSKRIATDLRKYQIAQRGEFIFDPMSLYYGAIGRFDVSERGVVSPDYVVFRVDHSVDPDYFLALVRSPRMWRRFESLSEVGNRSGKRRRLYWSGFRNIDIPLPPLLEQRRIAAILSSVDEAIEKKQAVINQVQTVKKGLIQELLTKGVPGCHEAFKQTEIGRIPVEWAIRPLDSFANVQTGLAKNKANAGELAVPYLRVANVQDGYLDLGQIKEVYVSQAAVERYRLLPGDVLFTEGGDADKLGRGTVWRGEIQLCLHQNHVFAVRVDQDVVIPEFLSIYGGSQRGKAYFLDAAKQTTNLASINSSQLRALPVPVPSLDEQRAIMEIVGAAIAKTQAEDAVLEALVTLKSALQSLLLTGELRVRPDPTPTPEPS